MKKIMEHLNSSFTKVWLPSDGRRPQEEIEKIQKCLIKNWGWKPKILQKKERWGFQLPYMNPTVPLSPYFDFLDFLGVRKPMGFLSFLSFHKAGWFATWQLPFRAGFVKIHVKRVLPHQMVPRSRSELPKLQDFCLCCSLAIDHRWMDLKTGWGVGGFGWLSCIWLVVFGKRWGLVCIMMFLFLAAYWRGFT